MEAIEAEPKPGDRDYVPSVSEMRALLNRGHAGDESVLPELRKLIARGTMAETFGNVARTADLALAKSFFGDDLTAREATLEKMKKMRAELGGENPPPLEALLVDRVASCWLQVAQADYIATVNIGRPDQADNMRRQNGAHRRYLGALRTLAIVRKLALPNLQVNVGMNQAIGPVIAGSAGPRSRSQSPPPTALPEPRG